jgi:hypothetical protein
MSLLKTVVAGFSVVWQFVETNEDTKILGRESWWLGRVSNRLCLERFANLIGKYAMTKAFKHKRLVGLIQGLKNHQTPQPKLW